MLPVLLNFAFIKIYTAGVFLVLAFFWGLFFLWKSIKLTSFKEEDLFDGVFIGLLGGLFFARVFYVILNFGDFGFDILKFILVNGYPGFSLYGGIFGGLLFFSLFLSAKKMVFIQVIDYVIPPLFLALGVAKLGGFFSGEAPGTRTSFFLRVNYSGYEGARHMTGLYESLLFFVGSYLSYRFLFWVRRGVILRGILTWFFLWYVGGVYLWLDFLKENQLYWGTLNFNVTLSAFIVIIFSLYFLILFRKSIIKGLGQLQVFTVQYVAHTFTRRKRGTSKKVAERGDSAGKKN